jgi:hypothetical protein
MLDVVGVGDGSLLVHIIQAPIPFIHISGLLYIYIYIYIYIMCQHLQLWLMVIRMLTHLEICPLALGIESECCWYRGGSLLVLIFEAPHSPHTHMRSSLDIYKVFQHLLQWPVGSSLVSALWNLRVDVLGVKVGFSGVGSYD